MMCYEELKPHEKVCEVKDLNTQEDSKKSGNVEILRLIFLLLYIIIPVFGWLVIISKLSYVRQGQMLAVVGMDNTTEEYYTTGFNLLAGILPWESKHVIKIDISKPSVCCYGNTLYAYVPIDKTIILSDYRLIQSGWHVIKGNSPITILETLENTCSYYYGANNSIYMSKESQSLGYVWNDDNKSFEALPRDHFIVLKRPLAARLPVSENKVDFSISAEISHPRHGAWDIGLILNGNITDIEKLKQAFPNNDEKDDIITLNVVIDRLKSLLKPAMDKSSLDKIEQSVNPSESKSDGANDPVVNTVVKELEAYGITVDKSSVFSNHKPHIENKSMNDSATALQAKNIATLRAAAQLAEAKGNADALRIQAKGKADSIRTLAEAQAFAAGEIMGKVGDAISVTCIMAGNSPEAIGTFPVRRSV